MIAIQYLPKADEFIKSLDEKTRRKIFSKIEVIKTNRMVDHFKKLTGSDDIWEFKILYNQTQYRILAFWDKTEASETLVICCNGFIKDEQKTPKAQIDLAEKLKNQYFG